jgi:hypothetical protein
MRLVTVCAPGRPAFGAAEFGAVLLAAGAEN